MTAGDEEDVVDVLQLDPSANAYYKWESYFRVGLYMIYFVLFLIRCGDCYEATAGTFLFLTVMIFLLLRYWKTSNERNKKYCSCCTKRCCCCCSSSMCSSILLNLTFLGAVVLIAHLHRPNDGNTTTNADASKPPGIVYSDGTCTRPDFMTNFLPCGFIRNVPVGIILFELLLNLDLPYWWKHFSGTSCFAWFRSQAKIFVGIWKVISLSFTLTCLGTYVTGIYFLRYRTDLDLPLCITLTLLVLLLSFGSYVLLTEEHTKLYMFSACLPISVLPIVSLAAFVVHFRVNCSTWLVHWTFLTDPKWISFGMDWTLWATLGLCQLIQLGFVLVPACTHLVFTRGERNGLVSIFLLPYLPLTISVACLYVGAALVIQGCDRCVCPTLPSPVPSHIQRHTIEQQRQRQAAGIDWLLRREREIRELNRPQPRQPVHSSYGF